MDTNETLQVGTLRDGANAVRTPDGKTTFTFTTKAGQVLSITAHDESGSPLPVTVKRQNVTRGGSPGEICLVCVPTPPTGTVVCFPVPCFALPSGSERKL